MLQACIFDLDGVVVDTAKYHYLAWKRLANSFGADFNELQNEKLKGVSRIQSLELILQWAGITLSETEKAVAAQQKNDWYLEYINQMQPNEILPGVAVFFEELKSNNIKIVLGSASKNAIHCLQKINMLHYFDAIVDGNVVSEAKPNPAVFITAAAKINVLPVNAVVFEDAQVGIDAALNGGFFTVGVGQADVLSNAHLVIHTFKQINLQKLQAAFGCKI
ncbi:MAG: beta-phosphoglucomutase [Bacteroidia bacterium]|nr:beta-phosphoglucomutase [Bacteroidia bacterium]HQV01182.1 beta-phosphoglucomutase [Bacteroidia bacterium]